MKAWELLSTPEKWTTRDYARDRAGFKTSWDDRHAACWCASGALKRIYGSESPQLEILRLRVGHVPIWNDSPNRTHSEVLAVLKQLDI